MEAAYPNLYVQITVGSLERRVVPPEKRTCTWHLLDLKMEKPVLMDWQTKFYFETAAVSLQSEIYLLGGYIVSTDEDLPDFYGGHVYKLDTAGSSTSFTLVNPVPIMPPDTFISAALSGKIYVLEIVKQYDELDRKSKHLVLEVYDPSSNKWRCYTEDEVNWPPELKGIEPDPYLLSDALNNRILVHYPCKGLYAFYSDSLRCECIFDRPIDWRSRLRFSSVVNGVLYYSESSADIRFALVALDLSNSLEQLRIVWCPGVDYEFCHDLTWKAPFDLGGGRICILSDYVERIDEPNKNSHSVSHSHHFYSSSSEDEDAAPAPAPSLPQKPLEYRFVVTGMVLEMGTECGRKGNKRLRVKKATRVRYEFDRHQLGGDATTVLVHHIIAVNSC